MVAGLISILAVVAFAGVVISHDETASGQSPTQQAKQPELIECYVNGAPVLTTRNNCAVLSQQKQQVVVQQRQLPPIEAPQINIPPAKQNTYSVTNCRQFFNGDVRCYTK